MTKLLNLSTLFFLVGCAFAESNPATNSNQAIEKTKLNIPMFFSLLSQDEEKALLKKEICQDNLQKASCSGVKVEVKPVSSGGIGDKAAFMLNPHGTCPGKLAAEDICRKINHQSEKKLYKLSLTMLVSRGAQSQVEEGIKRKMPLYTRIFSQLGCHKVEVKPDTFGMPSDSSQLTYFGFAQISGDCPVEVAMFPRRYFKKASR